MQKKFENVEKTLNSYFVERADEIRGLTLALLSHNNVLYLGPPGVAKSQLVKSWSMCIKGAKFFEHLVTKFTVPDELAGPFSLKGLEEDRFVRNTTNMLPEAHLAFLDEVWKGNSGVLNFLLKLMNERTFFNDGKEVRTPLLTMVGASNEVPESDDNLEAMQDRFVIKFMVNPIQEQGNFVKMLGSGEFVSSPTLELSDIMTAHNQTREITIDKEMLELLFQIRTELKAEEIVVTDRTFKKATDILRAEAWLNGNDTVIEDDFDCLQHVLWTDPEHRQRSATKLFGLVDPTRSKMLELMDDVRDLFSTSMKAEAKTKESVTEIMETIHKLKDARTMFAKYKKEAGKSKKHKKQLQTATKMLEEVTKMLKCTSEKLGFEVGV